MKHKYLLLFVLGFIGLSATVKQRLIKPDLNNMVLVKGGTFFMGIDSLQLKSVEQKYQVPFEALSEEYPAFRVTVQSFYIDKYEVTNADFKVFVDANPQWSKSNIADSLQDGNYLKDWKDNRYPEHKANYPVVYVSWYAARAYAQWKGKRLPMEAEFEFAAKGSGTDASIFPWVDADADTLKANYRESGFGQTVQVARYAPNSLGLYDMAGNVYEFCEDRWRKDLYADLEKFHKNRTTLPHFSLADNKEAAVRGGCWSSPAVDLRTTHREGRLMNSCTPHLGFRCAVSVPVKPDN